MHGIGLGSTGEEISVAGLGCMYSGSKVDKKTSFRLLDMYMDHGGNFLDSANKRCKGGENETLLGKWLKQDSAPSDPLISSKVGFPFGKIPRTIKKEIILSECEKSLRRLGGGIIDLYFAHAYDGNNAHRRNHGSISSANKGWKDSTCRNNRIYI